jgi:hypothetical protein
VDHYSNEPDLLDFSADASAFAETIVSPDRLDSPLTIGLFGAWGSGKTFFMRRLKAAVEELTSTPWGGKEPLRVAQVDFNAWHYAESNLHASLVTEIFGALRDPALLSELETVRGSRAELQDDLQRVKYDIESLQETRNIAAQQSVRLARELTLAESDGWLERRMPPSLTEAPTRFWTALFSGISLLAIVLAVMILLVTLFSFLFWFNRMSLAPVPQYTIMALGILALITVFLFIARAELLIRSVKRARRKHIEELSEEQRKAVDELTQQKVDADSRLETAQSRFKELVEHNERLKATANQELSFNRISDYLERVAQDREHGGRLGMLALVRRDLFLLSELLTTQRALFTRQRELLTRQRTDDNAPDRIIIYIDDLDRCSPQRVVATLEAIHLLLSFPLFVVVVAVDARWLSAALRHEFSGLLASPLEISGLDDSQSGMESATSLDYLEKIFHVPYWIRRLETDGAQRLLSGWLRPNLQQSSTSTHQDNIQPNSPAHKRENETAWDGSEEMALLADVAPLLGRSPRTVRRFVTVYRFLRATAPGRPKEHAPARWSAPDSELAVLLLALVHGVPKIAPAICNHIASARPGTPIGALFTSLDAATGVRDTVDWRRIKGSVEEFVDKHKGHDWNIDRLQYWAERARQFSFLSYV